MSSSLHPTHADQDVSIGQSEILEMQMKKQQSIDSLKPLMSLKPIESQIAALKATSVPTMHILGRHANEAYNAWNSETQDGAGPDRF